MENFKGLDYWKTNAEEDYRQVPISVLRYISELENHIERSKAPKMLEMLEKVSHFIDKNKGQNYMVELLSRGVPEIKQLIKEATEL
jgi:hypothetical protein